MSLPLLFVVSYQKAITGESPYSLPSAPTGITLYFSDF